MISKKIGKSAFLKKILYPDSGPDHSQNLMGSNLDQDKFSHFFHEDPTCSE